MAASSLEVGHRPPPGQPNGVNNAGSAANGPMPPNGHTANGNSMANAQQLANMPTPAGQALDYAVIHEMINELAQLTAFNREEGLRVTDHVRTLQERSRLIEDDPLASLSADAALIDGRDHSQIINSQKHILEDSQRKQAALISEMRRYEQLVRHWESTTESILVKVREHGAQVQANHLEWQRYWSQAWSRTKDEAISYKNQLIDAADHARTLGEHVRKMTEAQAEEKASMERKARDRESALQLKIQELQEELLKCGKHDLVGPVPESEVGERREHEEQQDTPIEGKSGEETDHEVGNQHREILVGSDYESESSESSEEEEQAESLPPSDTSAETEKEVDLGLNIITDSEEKRSTQISAEQLAEPPADRSGEPLPIEDSKPDTEMQASSQESRAKDERKKSSEPGSDATISKDSEGATET